MSQSRTGSIIETIVNTAIGWLVNFCANFVVLPLFGYHITVRDNIAIGVIYTLISIVRGFVIRRVFNRFRRL